ncbi:hypothetical protein N6H18_10640 [Reichenbachiella agarivorans]|uniref:Uncharacterized protein n=1 Tax=Reichenbachiella agarivorans TaxID=2979464 RepID=A0ABY6CR78_9BACT|nr:hypothetical protein [Reichenbachiella agarivorans]UXP30810.1 hypothetical protein N6H18_10640 [Reichenbachiella agarivorans]
MIYLWYNTEEKRMKMGGRQELKDDYVYYGEWSISVLNQLKPAQLYTAIKIVKRFDEMKICTY